MQVSSSLGSRNWDVTCRANDATEPDLDTKDISTCRNRFRNRNLRTTGLSPGHGKGATIRTLFTPLRRETPPLWTYTSPAPMTNRVPAWAILGKTGS